MISSILSQKRRTLLAALALSLALVFTGLATLAFAPPPTHAHADDNGLQLTVSAVEPGKIHVHVVPNGEYGNIIIYGDPTSRGDVSSYCNWATLPPPHKSQWAILSNGETDADIDLRAIDCPLTGTLQPGTTHTICAGNTIQRNGYGEEWGSNCFAFTLDSQFNVTNIKDTKKADNGSPETVADSANPGDSTVANNPVSPTGGDIVANNPGSDGTIDATEVSTSTQIPNDDGTSTNG